MPAPRGRHVEAADLGVEQVGHGRREAIGGLRIARQQLVAVHDLHHTLGPGAVGEVDAIAERDGPVDALRRGAGRARLLARQAEVADETRVRGVAQVIDLRHTISPPAEGRAVRDEVRDTGVALPPVLVRALEAVEHGGEPRRLRGIGHVPDLVGQVAERAQEVRLVLVGARQRLAVADSHHRRTARLRLTLRARDVVQIARVLRIGDIDDRRAVVLGLAGERIHPLAAVVADVGDPARALVVHDRLVRGARLEVVHPHQAHVALLLGAGRERDEEGHGHQTGQTGDEAPGAHGAVAVGIDAPPGIARGDMSGPQPTRAPARRSIANPHGYFRPDGAGSARRGLQSKP